MPPATAAALGELGAPAFLYVHTHVREDAIVLYGFASRDERRCFIDSTSAAIACSSREAVTSPEYSRLSTSAISCRW